MGKGEGIGRGEMDKSQDQGRGNDRVKGLSEGKMGRSEGSQCCEAVTVEKVKRSKVSEGLGKRDTIKERETRECWGAGK